MRRIGVLMPFTADDPEGQARLLAFAQGLQQLGWAVGNNLRIDARWGRGDAERNRKYAAELLALAPDLMKRFVETSLKSGFVTGELTKCIALFRVSIERASKEDFFPVAFTSGAI